MTTITYRDGVMAADRMAYGGSYSPSPGAKTKIFRLADGSLVGVCSNLIGASSMLVDWLEQGAPYPGKGGYDPPFRPDQFALLVVRPTGDVFYANDALSLSGPLVADFYAIGTGQKYALAAMACGLGPAEAIEVAAMFDLHSGCGTDALALEPKEQPS